jgi:hypothetical protein
MIVDLSIARARKAHRDHARVSSYPASHLDEIVACLTECREVERLLLDLQSQSNSLNERLTHHRQRASVLVEAEQGRKYQDHPLIG